MASQSRMGHLCAGLALTISTCMISVSGSPQVCAQDNKSSEDKAQDGLLSDYPTLRDLDTHCPFTPPDSIDAWKERSAQVKQQLLVSLGLLPLPKLEPIQPKVYGRIALDGYTIEKVTFETLPGFYVTGNLYRPDPLPEGKVPAVLCPHGHWSEARFYDASPAEIRQLLATGAERFENAARNHIQARCVHLARMGCVAFHWDMIGYCDSVQISFERAHRFGKQPKESEVSDDGWLLFSPLAESHAQSVIGLQTLAGMRSVDFVSTLPEVDTERIGITGASGGGTQSFITAAVDPRIAVSFPAVMVSTSMQGGCTCENVSGMRTGTNNVEMAAVIAPRPLGMTAANDWTRNMATDGFPELQKVYELFKAKDKVALFPAVHFGHNYNHVARVSMYGWMNKHFKLGLKEPVLERDFEWKGKDDLHVWDAEHPKPENGEDFERKLMKGFRDNIDQQFNDWLSHGKTEQLAETLMQGWQVCLGLTNLAIASAEADTNKDGEVQFNSSSDGKWRMREGAADDAKLVVHVRTEADKGSMPVKTYRLALIAQRFNEQGEIDEVAEQPLVSNPRLAAAYTYGYNPPLFARRARQLAATLQWLNKKHPDAVITIEGEGSAAALAAAGAVATELAGSDKLRLELSPEGFRFAKIDSIRDPNFLPASARYWDLPGLVSCFAGPVKINGDDQAEFDKLKPVRESHK